MKYFSIVFLLAGIIMTGCSTNNNNPFFAEWDTPFGTPPFDEISNEDFMPAILEGMKQEKAEIDAIVNNPEAPTFENTIVAFERCGSLLSKVNGVYGNYMSTRIDAELQKVAEELAPISAKHRDDINLNEKLFERIKSVYQKKDELDLTVEQKTLLNETYKGFVRGGADLEHEKKDAFRKINGELALLSVKFGNNILGEVNKFELVIDNEDDLAGLPDGVRIAASETAKAKGYAGKWVFTIDKTSLIPFLQYSEKRDLREKMYKAYIMQGDNNDELDNKNILSKIAALRVQRANLLGYDSHADFVLEEYMSKKPENVYNLLNQIWKPALKKAKYEAKELQKMIDREGGGFELAGWDWWFYAEKLKKEKYNIDDEILRPYFKLENVIEGAFTVATKLYGIQFEQRNDIQVWHPDVKVFEVKEADGSHIGILYTDYFPRSTKGGGAWMDALRKQYKIDGENISPLIYNCGNFTKPTADKPSLITMDEALTLFHEFGHGLHGLLSNCTYRSLSGTSVAQDFVELPSQVMENWASQPEVLRMYARHYETNEPIPDELIEKIKNAGTFNQGFVTTEYLAASFLDMDWHTLTDTKELDPVKFENESMNKIGLIPEITVRYRSTYFRHIFAGGYSSGYYSYIWSEVLDKDAFQAFKETGDIFDQTKAKLFRENVLSRGGTEDAMVLYKRFRGKEPSVEPLLVGRGLK